MLMFAADAADMPLLLLIDAFRCLPCCRFAASDAFFFFFADAAMLMPPLDAAIFRC